MKLGTEKCNKILKEFETKNQLEELAIEVLLISEGDDEAFANYTYKICDSDLSDDEIDELAKTVTNIRKELGIDEEIET